MTIKQEIITLLKSTKIPKVNELIKYLIKIGYFTSPASTRYHNNFKGGLAIHSLGVYKMYVKLSKVIGLKTEHVDVVLSTLLHDVCKCGLYEWYKGFYVHNEKHPIGHSELSLRRVGKYLTNNLQRAMIRYHMGLYGTYQYSSSRGEYVLDDLVHAFNWDVKCKVLSMADDLSTQKEQLEGETK